MTGALSPIDLLEGQLLVDRLEGPGAKAMRAAWRAQLADRSTGRERRNELLVHILATRYAGLPLWKAAHSFAAAWRDHHEGRRAPAELTSEIELLAELHDGEPMAGDSIARIVQRTKLAILSDDDPLRRRGRR